MKIMACYDGTNESMEGLREAIKHAKAFNAEVMLVTSIPNSERHRPEEIESVKNKLMEKQAVFEENSIPCKTHISFRGVDISAGEDLVQLASKEQVDAVFLGIRTRTRVGKFLLGAVAQWVMLKAECPVIGVKNKRAA